MEEEFETLLRSQYILEEKKRDYSQIYNFFTRAIQLDKKIYITPSLRELISFLSTADGGSLWVIAENLLANYDPTMLVPKITTKNIIIKKPKHLHLSPHPPSLPKKLTMNTPRPCPYKTTYLKRISDREILPKLAISPIGNFYYCTPRSKTSREPEGLSFNIHRKGASVKNKAHEVGTLTQQGLLQMKANKTSEFIEMDQFLEAKENAYMTRNLPLFQNWELHKSFNRWKIQLKANRYQKMSKHILSIPSLESTIFFDKLSKIKDAVYEALKTCHPINIDLVSDTFQCVKADSESCLEIIRSRIDDLNRQISDDLSDFFELLRGIAFLLRSDYEVLKTIKALPKSLIPYSLDDDTKAPSLTAIRVRNHLLYIERKLSHERKEYIPRFFILVRLILRDFLVEKIQHVLKEFYSRFTIDPPICMHQITLNLDENVGLSMNPSLEEFLEWFENEDHDIYSVFLAHQLELSTEENQRVFGDKKPPLILADERSVHTDDIRQAHDSAIQVIKDAYGHFEARLHSTQRIFVDLQKRLLQISDVDSYEASSDFIKVLDELKEIAATIENQPRIITFGALYTEMKGAKIQLLQKHRSVMEKLKAKGVQKASSIFDHIIEKRMKHNQILNQANLSGQPPDEKLIRASLTELQTESLEFLSFGTSITSNWVDGLNELREQIESVKEIIQITQNGLKKERVRRRISRKKETLPE